MNLNYKIIGSLIWFIGFIAICVPGVFNEQYPLGILQAALFSSIPFAGLGLYATHIFEKKGGDPYYKNLKLSGIAGAFVLTLLYAIWDFHIYITGFFWFLSLGTIFIGYIIGGLTYVVVKTVKRLNS